MGAVVLNRVASPDFPNTIAEVIYQPRAFDAVEDKQFYLTPNETALNAARDALNGWDPTNGALYYWNPVTATSPLDLEHPHHHYHRQTCFWRKIKKARYLPEREVPCKGHPHKKTKKAEILIKEFQLFYFYKSFIWYVFL